MSVKQHCAAHFCRNTTANQVNRLCGFKHVCSWLTVQCMHAQGTIDQVDGLIAFDGERERLLQWDDQIQGVCQSLNDILDGAVTNNLPIAA